MRPVPTAHRLVAALVLLGLMAPAARARSAAASSSDADDRASAADTVRYAVALADPSTKTFHVTAEFPAPGKELLVSLPAWSPGSYTIEDYARNVRDFSATDGSGHPLDWEKVDPDTWRVEAGGADVARLAYDVYADSLDLEKSKVFDDFAFFNGTNLFLFEPEHLNAPASVALELPAGWKAATALSSAGGGDRFAAGSYDQLVDSPTFIGRFQLDTFTAGGKPAQLAVYPAGAFSDDQRAKIREAIDRILTEENAIIGAAPYDAYTVFFFVGKWGTGFAGGLEHASSHFDILDPTFAQAFDETFPLLESLLAHECFHLWNVKRIRPAAMWPYDYDQWQPTELLWFSEGVTDYYADLSVTRAGLYSTDQFMGQIEMNLTRLAAEPGPVSLEDTSLDTWLNPTWGDPYIYYPKGSLVGLLLDIRIRHASDNRRSLDTVLRELYHDFYEQGRGFTTADLLGLLREAGVSDLDDFYRRYVDGRDPLPVAETLKLAGMRLEERDVSEPFLGVAGAPNEQGETVIGTIFPGSPAAEAGVEPGDVLLAVGDVRVEGVAEWPDRFRQAYAEKPGSPLEIRVRRNGAEQVLKTTVRLRTRQDFSVSRDPDAGRLEGEVFQGLVGGGGS